MAHACPLHSRGRRQRVRTPLRAAWQHCGWPAREGLSVSKSASGGTCSVGIDLAGSKVWGRGAVWSDEGMLCCV